MKERPILFSAPMVRALLAGTKTQTLRVVSPQPTLLVGPNFDGLWSDWIDPVVRYFACPYGQPGDLLWVKESFSAHGAYGTRGKITYAADCSDGKEPHGLRWTPSIFMPRHAVRVKLEVVSVRVERLQSITAADARAEGVTIPSAPCLPDPSKGTPLLRITGKHQPWSYTEKKVGDWTEDDWYVTHYAALWDSLNAEKAPWSSNPWVWVVEFRRVQP